MDHHIDGHALIPKITQVISEQRLTIEQFKVRVWALGFTKVFLNSVAFSLCIIAGWVLIGKVIKGTQALAPDRL